MALRMTTTTKLVLQALLHDPGQELYGLEVADLTGLTPGTIYPILVRLQGLGWVESRWEEIDPHQEKRPARRYYRITADGAVSAKKAIEAAQRTRRSRQPLNPVREAWQA
jgi:PadR family transcriptional regulator, regulatory protein PadR